jgi:PAS domain S-box-containing protein
MDMELRVLVVAAPSGDSGLVLDHLHRAGYHLLSERVDTLAAMDEALGAGTWDVIIAMYHLPAFSVAEALELVRQRQLDLPFIVVARTVTVQGVVAMIKAGAHDCIMMDELHRLAGSIERGRRDMRTRQAPRSAERGRHTEGTRTGRRLAIQQEVSDALASAGTMDAEEALRTCAGRTAAILEAALDGIIIAELDGRISEFNPAAERMFGYSRAAALGLELSQLIKLPMPHERHRRGWAQYLAADESAISGQVVETMAVCADGSEFPVELAIHATGVGGAPSLTACIRDISERKRAQVTAREIRDAERRRIARDLHDVVLQDLVWALQSLQVMAYQAWPGAQQDQVIATLRRTVQGLRDAIHNLRLGEDLSLAQSLEGLVALHRQLAPDLAIRLAVEDAAIGGLPASTVVEVSRIVHETLVNVRRHAAAQHVQITLWSDAQGLCVDVVDDGRGFDRETTWGGVGLAAMHERAEALDGQLAIYSARGMGTQVQLRIPRSVVQQSTHDLSALAG